MANFYRVYNVSPVICGGFLADGKEYQIMPGSFAMMTEDDIMYIESSRYKPKFFGDKYFIIKDGNDKIVPFEKFGITENSGSVQNKTKEEVEAALKGTVAKLKVFLDEVKTDKIQSDNVIEIAMGMQNLPANKLKLLKEAFPTVNFV